MNKAVAILAVSTAAGFSGFALDIDLSTAGISVCDRNAGPGHFSLRPNYLCYRGAIPRGYERFYHGNFMLNLENGMLACDYDGCPRHVMDFESYVIDRAAKTPGLIGIERKRVELRRLVCEHARRTHRFLLARDSMGRRDFGKVAMDMLEYRIGIHERLPDVWGRIFRSYPSEVRWWRSVPRSVIGNAYPEMALGD